MKAHYWRARAILSEAILRICFRRRTRNRAEHIRGLESKVEAQAREIRSMQLSAERLNSRAKALNILVACDGPCNRAYMDDPAQVDEEVVRIAVSNALRLLHWWRRGGQPAAEAYLERIRKDLRRAQ